MICLSHSRRELSKCVSAKSRFFDTFTDFFLTYAGVLAAVRVPLSVLVPPDLLSCSCRCPSLLFANLLPYTGGDVLAYCFPRKTKIVRKIKFSYYFV